MVNIIHRIGIKAPAFKVYNALSTLEGLSGWWAEEVEGDSNVGGNLSFSFRSKSGELLGKMVMVVRELNSSKLVRWQCLDGPADWIGTNVKFELYTIN